MWISESRLYMLSSFDNNCILLSIKMELEDLLSPVRHTNACLPLWAEDASDGFWIGYVVWQRGSKLGAPENHHQESAARCNSKPYSYETK
jgi:hypothetical protein